MSGELHLGAGITTVLGTLDRDYYKFSRWRWLGICCPGNPNSISAALLLVGGSDIGVSLDLDRNISTQPHTLNPKELNI